LLGNANETEPDTENGGLGIDAPFAGDIRLFRWRDSLKEPRRREGSFVSYRSRVEARIENDNEVTVDRTAAPQVTGARWDSGSVRTAEQLTASTNSACWLRRRTAPSNSATAGRRCAVC